MSGPDRPTGTPAPGGSGRSHGRIAVRPTLRPRELMTDTPDLAGVWRARVITLFPEVFPGVLGASLTGKALQEGLWQLDAIDLRQFGEGRHRNVDDTPAGGGAGMVLRADILDKAIRHAAEGTPRDRGLWPVMVMSPRGVPFRQSMARTLSQAKGMTLICGRFEGIDQRVIDAHGILEVSMGDFVLTGGEIAAQALIDATVRLIPRVLGNQASVEEESFSAGLLEHPQYTKPVDWGGRRVPDILLSGHHGHIRSWRQAEAERLTRQRRPDLWRAYCAQHGRDPDGDREL